MSGLFVEQEETRMAMQRKTINDDNFISQLYTTVLNVTFLLFLLT